MALLVLSKAGLFKRSCHSKLRIYAHILFYYNTLTENIFSNNSLELAALCYVQIQA